MLIRTLGVTGSASGPRSPASCYLLQVPAAAVAAGIKAGTVSRNCPVRDWSIAIDMGQGGFGLLERHVRAHDIDAVAISHLHSDHFADISSLYVHLKYHPVYGYEWTKNPPRVPVWGPTDIAPRLAAACGHIDEGTGCQAFEPSIWGDDMPVQIGPITIIPRQMYHSVETYGMRFIGPTVKRGGQLATIVYSGDTDYCSAIVELAADADLFLCEASFLTGRDSQAPPGLHITGRQAGQIATEASAEKLILVHIPSWNSPEAALAEARETFSGDIEVAICNGVFEV